MHATSAHRQVRRPVSTVPKSYQRWIRQERLGVICGTKRSWGQLRSATSQSRYQRASGRTLPQSNQKATWYCVYQTWTRTAIIINNHHSFVRVSRPSGYLISYCWAVSEWSLCRPTKTVPRSQNGSDYLRQSIQTLYYLGRHRPAYRGRSKPSRRKLFHLRRRSQAYCFHLPIDSHQPEGQTTTRSSLPVILPRTPAERWARARVTRTRVLLLRQTRTSSSYCLHRLRIHIPLSRLQYPLLTHSHYEKWRRRALVRLQHLRPARKSRWRVSTVWFLALAGARNWYSASSGWVAADNAWVWYHCAR